eukprot:8238919-Prorocentrum_lima.AAC.1
MERGGVVAIEWPRGCRYWRDACVKRLVVEHDLKTYDLDGWMYNIITSDGLPMLKPWGVKTNCHILRNAEEEIARIRRTTRTN